ncbi:MAG: hypothetical protein ACI8SZ_002644, partial [Colwellia sp.]
EVHSVATIVGVIKFLVFINQPIIITINF